MRVTLVPSAPPGRPQMFTSFLIDGAVAIDAGCLAQGRGPDPAEFQPDFRGKTVNGRVIKVFWQTPALIPAER